MAPHGRGPNKRGSIYESPEGSGVWFAQLPPDECGKRPKRRAKSEQEAVQKLIELERERAQGLNPGEQDPILGQHLNNWLEVSVKPNVKQGTYEDRVWFVNHYLIPPLGKIRLKKLTSAHIQRALNDMLARGLARETVRTARRHVITALNVAIEWKLLPQGENAARRTKIARDDDDEDGATMRRLTAEQAQHLLDILKDHRLWAMYFLALTYGPRQGELVGLRWSDIDLKKREITIRSQVRRRKKEIRRTTPKTPKSRRTLLIDDTTVTILSQQAKLVLEERTHQQRKDQWEDHNLVFPSEVGTPLHASALHRQFKAALKAAELPDIRFHDLRHTAASLMLENGVPLPDVSEILGHANPGITARLYLHGSNTGKRAAAETMTQLLRRAR